MKGAIVNCPKEMPAEQFGRDSRDAVTDRIPDPPKIILPFADIEDGKVVQVVGTACEVLRVTLQITFS